MFFYINVRAANFLSKILKKHKLIQYTVTFFKQKITFLELICFDIECDACFPFD